MAEEIAFTRAFYRTRILQLAYVARGKTKRLLPTAVEEAVVAPHRSLIKEFWQQFQITLQPSLRDYS